MEENEKIIFNTLLKNYEELQRIIRKTEYEIYVGELKSKLIELKYRKVLSQAMDLYPTSLFYPFTSLLLVLPIAFLSSFHDIDRKISDLQYEISNAEKKITVGHEILHRILLFLKLCVNENEVTNIEKEAQAINIEIQKSIIGTLESSLQYKIKTLESRLSKGRIYLAQMKDSQRKYDSIKKNLYSITGDNLDLKASEYEKLYDETSEAIYEADLSIKDSKWLRVVTYSSLIVGVIGVVLTVMTVFSSSLF
jgi:hypothetical protein